MPVSCSVVLSSLCAFRLVGGSLIHSGFGVVIQLDLLLACCVGLTVLEAQSFAWVFLLCVGLAFAWLSICGGSILCRHRVARLWIGGSQFKRYSVRKNSGMFLVCDFKTKIFEYEACTVYCSRSMYCTCQSGRYALFALRIPAHSVSSLFGNLIQRVPVLLLFAH